MPEYRVRPGTIDDLDALVHHRIAMFEDMGLSLDVPVVAQAYRAWLETTVPDHTYRAWVVDAVDADRRSVVSGGGLIVMPWPPGPWALGDRIAFIYNIYTEPSHRRRGLARLVMNAMHAWCLDQGIGAASLNASSAGRPLYESLGYAVRTNPMMVCAIDDPEPPSGD